MKDLNNLIGRIKDSLDKDAAFREAVAGIIKEQLGFDIRLKDISLNRDTLRIQTSPAKRSEIKLNETKILNTVIEKTNLNLKKIVY